MAHVPYRYRGGEDAVVERQVKLMEAAGHLVWRLDLSAGDFESLAPRKKMSLVLSGGDHEHGRGIVRQAVAAHEPHLVHFHNLYPLLGYGAMQEASRLGCAVVRTLHNYRISCVAGVHLLRGEVCERCSPLHHRAGIFSGCYRGSRIQSLVMSRWTAGDWTAARCGAGADVVLALTEFAREKYVRYGLDPASLRVTPNSGPVTELGLPRSGVCFVGRLSPEKGIAALVAAWPAAAPVLRVAGEGPDLDPIRVLAGPNVELLGPLGSAGALRLMATSRAVAMPSRWYEGFPLTLAEALGAGTPVVPYRILAASIIAGLVEPDLVCETGDVEAIVDRCCRVAAMNEPEFSAVSHRAREVHQQWCSPAAELSHLEAAYEHALRRSAARRASL